MNNRSYGMTKHFIYLDLIIVNLFLQCKLLSAEAYFLCVHVHTGTCTHSGRRQLHRMETMAGLLFRKKKGLEVKFEQVQSERFFPRGMSCHVDDPKIENVQGPCVQSLVQGIWRMRASEAEKRVREDPIPFYQSGEFGTDQHLSLIHI